MLRLVSVVLAFFLPTSVVVAQQNIQQTPSQAELRAKHDRIAAARVVPSKELRAVCSLLDFGGRLTTELQLRNNMPGQNLTVTPALRLQNGSEVSLSPVTVLPLDVKTIDLAKATIGSPLAGLPEPFGSIVLRYQSPTMRNLYPSVMVHKHGRPIMYHLDGSGEDMSTKPMSREGIWWLPSDNTRDYLVLVIMSQPMAFP